MTFSALLFMLRAHPFHPP